MVRRVFCSITPTSAEAGSGSTPSALFETNYYDEELAQRRIRRSHTRLQRQNQWYQSNPAQESYPSFSSPTVSSLISYRRSSSLLRAALLTDPSSSGRGKRNGRGRRPNVPDKKGPGWHRRLLGKISFRRHPQGRRGGSESSSSLPSSSIELQEAQSATVEKFVMFEEENKGKNNEFVAQNFDSLIPGDVLPVVEVDKKPSPRPKLHLPGAIQEVHGRSKPLSIDSEYFDVSIAPAMESSPKKLATKRTTPANTKKGIVCRLLKNILLERIGQRWAIEQPEGLKVDVRPSPDGYNSILRLVFRGIFRADATLSSDRIVFPMIRFSSIRLLMDQVTLNLLGFFVSNQEENRGDHEDIDRNNCDNHNKHRMQRQNQQDNQSQTKRRSNSASSSRTKKTTGKVRYPKQFDVHIEDLTMSRHDLLFSPCIKNGLRQLLINILKDRGIRSDSIQITSIDLLRNGKIACIGEAKMHFPSWTPVRFEVRSGISFSNRGHVLTFPGLEVALNRDIGLFVPVHPTLDLDVGHNTKFRSIEIDGREKLLKIAASVTITPDRTRLTQDYVQTSEAFSAIFFYDVGQWLTRLGRFSK